MNCTIPVAKTKALISFAVTVKLILAFVFSLAKIRFSHDADHTGGFVLELVETHKDRFSHITAQLNVYKLEAFHQFDFCYKEKKNTGTYVDNQKTGTYLR